jgi:hypothetical protein
MRKKLSQNQTRPDLAHGMTCISPVRNDPYAFYNRLLLSGLRFAPAPVRTFMEDLETGRVIAAFDELCTGYLFGTDGVEAPESDIREFFSVELKEGDWITISGRYTPAPGQTVQSVARFAMVSGQLMSTEERVLIEACGRRQVLRSRSDLEFDNVVPFRPPVSPFGPGR